eukprot:4465552-Pyramimonas_sp.AAC.1
MTAVMVLASLAADVIQPSGHLATECRSMLLLKRILDILSVPDFASLHVHLLERATDEHHDCYKRAYGHNMCKPKYHYGYHVPECVDRHGEVVSCFSMERRHKDAKCLSQHSPGPGWEHTILRRQLVHAFSNMERCVIPEWLGESKPMESLRHLVQQVHSQRIGEVRGSKHVTTVRGTIKAGNLVLLSE